MKHRNKQIAIILADTLRTVGLQSLLVDYFSPVEVDCFPVIDTLITASGDTYDYLFTDPETFALNPDYFLPRRGKTALLVDHDERSASTPVRHVSCHASQEIVIGQLKELFTADTPSAASEREGGKELSSREADVLKLVARGITNKEIADRLNISLNTVLTHRKNITAKLGVKTVSGLTFYAIMNGLVSGEEL